VASYFTEFMAALTSWTGLAIFGIGFLSGILPWIATQLRQQQQQQTTDMSASIAQMIQAMVPIMLIMSMMQMFMGAFRMR
jgi:peptidoglycan biosynthesis protein MviN/MurJ (putative lipid II flippase)